MLHQLNDAATLYEQKFQILNFENQRQLTIKYGSL